MAPPGGGGRGRRNRAGGLLHGLRADARERADGRGLARRVRRRRRTPQRDPPGQVRRAERPDAGRRAPDRAPGEERREGERRRRGGRVRRHLAPAPGDRPQGRAEAARRRARTVAGPGADGRGSERHEPHAGAVRRQSREARRRGSGLRGAHGPRVGQTDVERCRAAPDRGREEAGVRQSGPGERRGPPHPAARPDAAGTGEDPGRHRQPQGARAVGRHREPHGQRAIRADDGQPPGLPRGRPGVAGRGDCGTARPRRPCT